VIKARLRMFGDAAVSLHEAGMTNILFKNNKTVIQLKKSPEEGTDSTNFTQRGCRWAAKVFIFMSGLFHKFDDVFFACIFFFIAPFSKKNDEKMKDNEKNLRFRLRIN